MSSKTKAKLDDYWIEAGLSKHRANFSNVIFFETDDRQRYAQLIRYLPGVEDLKNHKLFEITPWNGLQRWNDKKIFQPINRGDGDRFAVNAAQRANMAGSIRDLGESLRHMDSVLKEEKAILILRDFDKSDEQGVSANGEIIAAIRSWATCVDLMLKRSVVMCFCSRVDRVVDQQTSSQTAIINIDLGSDVERFCILLSALAALNYDIGRIHASDTGKVYLEKIVRYSAGLNLHQLNSILMECHYKDGEILPERVSALKNTWIQREDVVEILQPARGFSMVGGYESQKQFIIKNIVDVLNRVDEADYWGNKLPKGILLFGPPGTGKSLFAKALAGETNLPFINLKTENLYKKYLGESGQSFAKAIKIIEKNAPALVFIDEIDRFGSRHSSGNGDGASQESRRVFNQLLEWLGGERGSILVGTTNRPEDLDPAFLRPGRLDYKIAMLHPDLEARRQILRIHLGMTGVYPQIPVQQADLLENIASALAKMTELFSGAELEELVHRIRRKGFNSGEKFLSTTHVEDAVKGFRINQAVRRAEAQEYERLSEIYADQADMAR